MEAVWSQTAEFVARAISCYQTHAGPTMTSDGLNMAPLKDFEALIAELQDFGEETGWVSLKRSCHTTVACERYFN